MEKLNHNINAQSASEKEKALEFCEKLMSKPSKKPDFSMPLPKSSILSQLKEFLPKFKESTEEILTNDDLRKRMWIELNDGTEADSECNQLYKAEASPDAKQFIELNIGFGIYDVNEADSETLLNKVTKETNPWLIIDGFYDEAKENSESDSKNRDQKPKKMLIQELIDGKPISSNPFNESSSDSSDDSEDIN